jgi:hypothetical protein
MELYSFKLSSNFTDLVYLSTISRLSQPPGPEYKSQIASLHNTPHPERLKVIAPQLALLICPVASEQSSKVWR